MHFLQRYQAVTHKLMELRTYHNRHISSCIFSIWILRCKEIFGVLASLKIGIWTSFPLYQQLKSTSYWGILYTWTSTSLFFELYDASQSYFLCSTFPTYYIYWYKKNRIQSLQFYQTNPWDNQHIPKLDSFFHMPLEEFWTSDRFADDHMVTCYSFHTSYNLSFHFCFSLESGLDPQPNLVFWSCYLKTCMLNYNRTELIRI